jgi:hypothetical protein
MMLVGAVSLATASCQTVPAVEGAGFKETAPKPATVTYLRTNDAPFLADTAGNNRACKRSPACQKKAAQ